MNVPRSLAAITAATAVTLAVTASASASLTSPRRSPAGPHAVPGPRAQIRGFRAAARNALPRTASPRAAASSADLSTNWSGYAAVADKNVSLRWVSAFWNIPSINGTNCAPGSSGYAYAVHWVGLDGYGTTPNGTSDTGEEIGVEGYCNSSGSVTYLAWYDMYPDKAQYFTGIYPGDAITASVYYNSGTGSYTLILTDVTNNSRLGESATCPASFTCRNASAEVITGAPGEGPPMDNLADFGMSNFTGATVTSRNGTKGTLAASNLWTSSEVTMANNSGTDLATPSALEGGQAFNVTWKSSS